MVTRKRSNKKTQVEGEGELRRMQNIEYRKKKQSTYFDTRYSLFIFRYSKGGGAQL
jgi:hypothetical protein